MTEIEQEEETDIDAQADLVEEEMDRAFEEDGGKVDLTPWLVPALIIVAFVAIILIWGLS